VCGVPPARIEQGFQPPGRAIDEERADSVGHSSFYRKTLIFTTETRRRGEN
jgi:hypothetical protein